METVFGVFAIAFAAIVLLCSFFGYFEGMLFFWDSEQLEEEGMEQSKLNWTFFSVFWVHSLLFLLINLWDFNSPLNSRLYCLASGIADFGIAVYILIAATGMIWNFVFLLFKKELNTLAVVFICLMILSIFICLMTYGVVFEKGWLWYQLVLFGMMVVLGIGNLFLAKPGEKPFIDKLVKRFKILSIKQTSKFEVVEGDGQKDSAYHRFEADDKVYLDVLELSGQHFNREELKEQLEKLENKYRYNCERLRMNQEAYQHLCGLM